MSLTLTPSEIVTRAEASGAPGLLVKAAAWERVRLGDVARVMNGAAFPSIGFNADGRGMPLIRIRDVGTGGTATWFEGDWQKQHLVRHGDILIGMDGDFRVATWRGGDALLNQRVCRIDVDSERYERGFLVLVLQGYLDAIWAATSSVTVKHLSSRSIADIPLPNPSLDEQRRIVAILEDDFSRLDAAQSYLASAKQRVKAWQSAATEAELWHGAPDARPVGELLREPMRNGRSDRAVKGSETGTRTLTLTAVTRNQFSDEFTKLTATPAETAAGLWLKPGDILVQRSNTPELVGTAALYQGPTNWAIFPDLLIRLRPDESVVDSRFLVAALRSDKVHRTLRARAKGLAGSMPKIDQRAIAETVVPVPALARQREAVARIAEIEVSADAAVAQIDQQHQRSLALRHSLLAAAFSGTLVRAGGRSSTSGVLGDV